MTIANSTEGLNSIEKGLQIWEKTDSNEKHVSTTKLLVRSKFFADLEAL